MNNLRRNIAAAALASVMAMVALAQPSRTPGASRLDFLAGYLSLTDAQKAQATTIFSAAATASETARGVLTAAREALTAAVKANRADTELDRLAAAVGAAHGQIEGIHAKAEARFYALLTAEQKTKYDARNAQRGGDRRKGD
jgi:Spy/CpxP family protein refolding chaperone